MVSCGGAVVGLDQGLHQEKTLAQCFLATSQQGEVVTWFLVTRAYNICFFGKEVIFSYLKERTGEWEGI